MATSIWPGTTSARDGYVLGTQEEKGMDKDRIKGAVNQAKGTIKEAAGRATGDPKTEAEGKAEKLKGKVQSAAGEAKDTLRDVTRDNK
jgi:uncharacterized protein YjbJ (UPF0337 family)